MIGLSVANIIILLLIASIVAMASRRLRLPYSVGLVVAGAIFAFVPRQVDAPLTPDLIFYVFLPPLIFEAALQLRWKPFRRDLPVTITLAFVGVAIAAAIVAVGMHALTGWSWIGAAIFGVLIAATDPVSVIAAFKEMRVDRRLSGLVESESLLNDGAAAVGFAFLAALAAGREQTPTMAVLHLGWSVAGGTIIGVATAAIIMQIAGRTRDHLVEITLTTVTAYGSFLIAESAHASGVLAALAAGLWVGNRDLPRAISEEGRGHVLAFWDYVAFLSNSFVFILIGEQEAQQRGSLLAVATFIAIGLTLLGRIMTVYPICALFSRSSLAVEYRYQHVLFWGGLRGALGLALALAVPTQVAERGAIVAAAFGVVAFSLFVQGLTIPIMLRYLRLTEP
jgi:CPA1 family monovalent cation:H+ antiporter